MRGTGNNRCFRCARSKCKDAAAIRAGIEGAGKSSWMLIIAKRRCCDIFVLKVWQSWLPKQAEQSCEGNSTANLAFFKPFLQQKSWISVIIKAVLIFSYDESFCTNNARDFESEKHDCFSARFDVVRGGF